MSNSISRRDFLKVSAQGVGAAVISYSLMGCGSGSDVAIPVTFSHGVASGDPLTDAVILWTRVTPAKAGDIRVAWQVALDSEFTQLVRSGETVTTADRDYTVKVDAVALEPSTTYYYRFFSGSATSPVGKTKTLMQGDVASVKLAVVCCSNYPAGYFNVYDLVAQQDDLDAVLHIGDYIYEYGRGQYASEHAEALNRQVLPPGELLTLSDYRTRYAQYHQDSSLQKLSATYPFITVWDDHEVANDAWREGAENHQADEGDYEVRKEAAVRAYFEWLPIRPWSEGDNEDIYRRFQFGDLVDLYMLDTRLLARDKQLDYTNYVDTNTGTIDQTSLDNALSDPQRTMMGDEQFNWLENAVDAATGRWQVLGQQVLMGKMYLPAALVFQFMTFAQYAELGTLAQLAARVQAGDSTVTADEQTYVAANISKLTTEVMAQLQLPNVPYNLDAWDGYGAEREKLLQVFSSRNKNLVVLAGDTHNAWANELSDNSNHPVGVEFATASVSSPGLEQYIGVTQDTASATEASIVGLIDGLKYTNMIDRGFLTVTFTPEQAKADWYFVDTILDTHYSEKQKRHKTGIMTVGTPSITLT